MTPKQTFFPALAITTMALILAVSSVQADPPPPVGIPPVQSADPAPGKQPPAAPDTEEKEPALPPNVLPGLTIDARKGHVDVEATVCLDQGALELIACTKDSKEHESVVVVNARPIHIHTALLLLGARNGNPPMRRPVNKEMTRWVDIPARGDLIEVFLEFKDAGGKLVERPISDFITRTRHEDVQPGAGPEEAAARFPGTFIFAGSHLQENEQGPKDYLADLSGHVISIATFGDELLCLPEVHSQENGALAWSIDPAHLPKKETPVTLRLRLKKNPDSKPNP